jgi:hypothetical protein
MWGTHDPRGPGAGPPAPVVGAPFALTILPRHGRRPLGFQGRLLVAAELDEPGLPVASRIALHETAEGGLVAAIRHALRAPLEQGTRDYAEAAPAEALLGFLHAHDPLRDLPAEWMLQAAGDPDDAERLAAAAALAPRLRAAWRSLVDACFGLPDTAEAFTEHHAGDPR